jgi:hypothetical protein
MAKTAYIESIRSGCIGDVEPGLTIMEKPEKNNVPWIEGAAAHGQGRWSSQRKWLRQCVYYTP